MCVCGHPIWQHPIGAKHPRDPFPCRRCDCPGFVGREPDDGFEPDLLAALDPGPDWCSRCCDYDCECDLTETAATA